MAKDIFTLLSVVAPLALMIGLWVIAQISRRFGEVTHRSPIYRGFYAALMLVICPVVVRLLAIGLTDNESADLGHNSAAALLHDLPLAVSVTLATIITWRYWGWLVYAREGQDPVSPPPSKQQRRQK